MKKIILVAFFSVLITGCSSILPGNFVNSYLVNMIPVNKNICIKSTTTPSVLNANEILKNELISQGFPVSCNSSYILASWSHKVSNPQTEVMSTPSVGSTHDGTYIPGNTISSVSYDREFLLNLYDGPILSGNSNLLWSIQLTSRGSTSQIGELMKIWAPIVASNWGQNVSNDFVPNSGVSMILD